ncbi:MAG TPA: indole-3-glycerol phosphate synthase TrpC [Opitutales bacterium]|nr:indole-3-glycerol phosphate synthase TrpC [Opitutales bacterium]
MSKLDEIIAWKRREIEDRIRPVAESEFSRWQEKTKDAPRFADFLRKENQLAIIAEIKRGSPSAGMIADGISAVEQAEKYAAAGADALSILTDAKYFSGSLDDLKNVTAHLANGRPIPCLRKDFMVHPIQVIEALEVGARAILVIVRALSDDEMKRIFEAASLAGLDILVEVHEEREVERALRLDGIKILGVNNRDLAQFKTDLAFSEKIIPQLPDHLVKISESGIHSAADARRVRAAGADAVLVGEALMRAADPSILLREIANS